MVSNPEMQKRAYNLVRALVEEDDNPVVSIHDHGSAGHLNCLSELVEECGGQIDMTKLPIGDKTLSAKEIIANESQERMGLLIDEKHLEHVQRIAERERATEKLVTALLPVVDDIERAIDHARSQELADDFKQFVDGVDAVHAKLLDVFAHEGVEPIDPKGEAFDPLEHQAVGRVEDASQYDETVNDVYQKGYRMADRILRSAMVTVTYGGEKRPAPEPEAAPEDAAADTAESTEE